MLLGNFYQLEYKLNNQLINVSLNFKNDKQAIEYIANGFNELDKDKDASYELVSFKRNKVSDGKILCSVDLTYKIVKELGTSKKLSIQEKMKQALEIIFNKNVDMALFKWIERADYNLHFKDNNTRQLTQAEWDLLQEMLDAFKESE